MLTALRLLPVLAGKGDRRAAYLVVTVALVLIGWLGLSALASPFVKAEIPFAGEILVKSLQPSGQLPMRYVSRIESLPGVAKLYYQNFNPLICKPPSTSATLNGTGGPGLGHFLDSMEADIDDKVQAAWRDDPLGILVGSALAERCGWRKGMAIEPMDIAGQRVQLHIVDVFTSRKSALDQIAVAHFDYINRMPHLFGPRDHAKAITVYAKNASESGRLAASIEAEFTHDDPPVEATTSTSADVGLARFGNIRQLLSWVMLALFATTAMVLVSVFAHRVAERRSMMATLLVLGFRRGTLFTSLLIDCLLILCAGAVLGLLLGTMVVRALAPKVAPLLGEFAVPTWAYTYIPLGLAALLLLSLALPTAIVRRTRPTDYPVT